MTENTFAIRLAGCALTGGLSALACSTDSHRGAADSGAHGGTAGSFTVDAAAGSAGVASAAGGTAGAGGGAVDAAGTSGAAGTGTGGTPSLPPLPPYDGGTRGCDATRVAIAHAPGGPPLSPQPGGAPHTCYYATGAGVMDPMIALHPSGELFFAPVTAATGVARSKDDGVTWSGSLTPELPAGSWVHPWLYVDPVTGRLFFSVYDLPDGSCPDKGGGAQLFFSDDLGATWENHVVGCDSKDYGKVISGPAVKEESKALLKKNGYGSVLYYCAEGPTPVAGPDRYCYRSFDGGKTFARTPNDAFDQARDDTNGFPLAGSVAPDGTIYTCMTSTKGLAVSVSRDEGDTWKVVRVPGSAAGQTADVLNDVFLSNNVATGEDNAVYAAWVDESDRLPHLSVSKDHGDTWSTPIVLGAPGVKLAKYVSVKAAKPGYVAVEYWGTPDRAGLPDTDGYLKSDGRRYDGYLAVVKDVFAAEPVIWSARISATTGPLIPNGVSFFVGEYLGPPVFTKDGAIWGAFSQHIGAQSTLAVRMDAPP